MQNNNRKLNVQDLQSKIMSACRSKIGVLDSDFLCQSVGLVGIKDPLCVSEKTTLLETINMLQKNSLGCVVVTEQSGELIGIFSERDVLIKVAAKINNLEQQIIKDFMTLNPITISPEDPIAYALNLMSEGGFRHLPVIDEQNLPIGLISVKDIVDYIVKRYTEDLLS